MGAPDLFLADAFRKVPAVGIDLWPLRVAWADPAPLTLPVTEHEDLPRLESHGIKTVRDLLGARPSSLVRDAGIGWESLTAYRLIARWLLIGAAIGARRRLASQGWSDSELRPLSTGLAHALAEAVNPAAPVPVVVQMADVLTREQLAQYGSRAERIAAQQQHAEQTQGPVLAESQIAQNVELGAWLGNQIFADLTPEQIRRVARQRPVRQISPALNVRATLDQAMPRINAVKLRGAATGNGELVVVLDSGVDPAHPDLLGRVTRHKDYTGRGNKDEFGHGTHMAGIIGGKHATYDGVAPDAEIWSYRILDHSGASVSRASISKAVQDAASDVTAQRGNQTFVINCSFEVPISYANGPDDFEEFCDAFDAAANHAVVIAAAGNKGPEPAFITAPAGGSRVIAVGASVSRPAGNLDVVSFFSSRGPATHNRDKPDVVAPGGFTMPQGLAHADVSIVSARVANSTLDLQATDDRPWPVDQDHYGLSGTSQAAAMVSGLAALLLEEGRSRGRNPDHIDVKDALTKTARRLGYRKHEEGHGLVQGDAALGVI